jgi:hypothetical protein
VLWEYHEWGMLKTMSCHLWFVSVSGPLGGGRWWDQVAGEMVCDAWMIVKAIVVQFTLYWDVQFRSKVINSNRSWSSHSRYEQPTVGSVFFLVGDAETRHSNVVAEGSSGWSFWRRADIGRGCEIKVGSRGSDALATGHAL